MAMLSPGPLTVPEFVPVMEALPAQIESGDWRQKAMADCRVVLLEDIADHFSRKEGPDGPWAPRKSGGSHPLLVKTSLMFQASVGTATGHIDRMGDGELEVGVDPSAFRPAPYPLFHHQGTRRMPARQSVWASDQAQAECAALIAEHLQAELF